MSKILCVLYDDPVTGYPQSYARDDVPKVDRYPGGQTAPTPKQIDFQPGALLGSVQTNTHNPSGTATNPLSFFEAVPATAKNISTRLAVGTNDNVLIGGFIVTGNASKKVIVRAIGPSLAQYHVPNLLQDPTLELYDHTGAVIKSNDNWMNDPGAAQIQANHLAPGDPRESATIVTLQPGNYTVIVRGKNNTTGNALIEVYDVGTASLDISSKEELIQ